MFLSHYPIDLLCYYLSVKIWKRSDSSLANHVQFESKCFLDIVYMNTREDVDLYIAVVGCKCSVHRFITVSLYTSSKRDKCGLL